MIYYIGLGSNLGDRNYYLQEEKNMLSENRIIVLRESRIIETEPFGVIDQPNFLNQVIEVKTEFSPQELLKIINKIESELGRIRVRKWGERTIDIDILFCENQIIEEENLIIPHLGVSEREFVLVSLNELIPEFIHPKLNKKIKNLYNEIIS